MPSERDADRPYRWKVENDEGFVPPTAYYGSDRVAERAEKRSDRRVTIVGWDDD